MFSRKSQNPLLPLKVVGSSKQEESDHKDKSDGSHVGIAGVTCRLLRRRLEIEDSVLCGRKAAIHETFTGDAAQ